MKKYYEKNKNRNEYFYHFCNHDSINKAHYSIHIQSKKYKFKMEKRQKQWLI